MQEITCSDKNQISTKDYILTKIDEIFEMIENNCCYSEIAKKLGVSQSYLCEIINQNEHRARKELALEIASDKQILKARNHLESINEDDTNASVRKKSELSQFELYLAKVKCRKKYDLNYREDKQETNQQILVIPSAEALQLIKVNKDNKNQELSIKDNNNINE